VKNWRFIFGLSDHLVSAGEQRQRHFRRALWQSCIGTRWKAVGCSTGSSAGLAPRRILSG
jgi:hypothetical protein